MKWKELSRDEFLALDPEYEIEDEVGTWAVAVHWDATPTKRKHRLVQSEDWVASTRQTAGGIWQQFRMPESWCQATRLQSMRAEPKIMAISKSPPLARLVGAESGYIIGWRREDRSILAVTFINGKIRYIHRT